MLKSVTTVLISGWVLAAGFVEAVERQQVSAPSESADRFLRTQEAISSLTFSIVGREGWVISDVVFGVRDGKLMMAKFSSVAPDGTVGFVDESRFAEVLIEDTTQLRGRVVQKIGDRKFHVRGFTLGRGENGEAFVDWLYMVGPDRAPIVQFFDPSDATSPQELPLCKIRQRAVCGDVCTGNCVISGGDPCDCNASGFCFVDYYVYSCTNVSCDGRCQFIGTYENCGCVVGYSAKESSGECSQF